MSHPNGLLNNYSVNQSTSTSPPNGYSGPGAFPISASPRVDLSNHNHHQHQHHPHQHQQSPGQPRQLNYDTIGVAQRLQETVTLSSPRSVHTRSPSANINEASLMRRSSSRKRQPNYLKLIPPLPNPPSTHTAYSSPSTSSTKNTSNNPNFTPPTSVSSNSSTVCETCKQSITTKSVKALGKRYHTHCFGCVDCGTPILSKYFPFETSDGSKIPLCEEHFYKRRGLICCVCDSYLKGTHYTVFGRKYDAEHFCCRICSKKFEADEDFFNHDGSIYCHYHFSKFFIERCEGCEFAILKQYVEIFRGGKNQKWHVECYMIHKCWNVPISPNSIGLQSFPKLEPNEENTKHTADINPSPEELLFMEARASEKISDIWNTLFKFEEDTATCISDMLLFATGHDQQRGLQATARLVLNIDALFKSIDSLHRLGIDPIQTNSTSVQINDKTNFHTLKKEPRNLSSKIMTYLSVLRKISKGASDANSQDSILSVVTGLAHYLKLLIRYGLNNSLEYNKGSHTTNALDKFLREVRNHESMPDNSLHSLNVPVAASDLCFHCHKSVESECVQYQDKRWHIDCLHCTQCRKQLNAYGGIADAAFNSKNNWVLCAQCAMSDPDAKAGFKPVSKLLQLIYLLKIAIVRSDAVMKYEKENNTNDLLTPSRRALPKNELEQGYLKTLNDIKRLRSTRQNTRISDGNTRENARKSVVIESADQELESPSKVDNLASRFLSEEYISKQKITVEDEPIGPTLSKKSFNRATNFINSQKVLTLDDIPRIVAAEHARELRPNTYKFHNPHQGEMISESMKKNNINVASPSIHQGSDSNVSSDGNVKYYSQLGDNDIFILSHISAVVLRQVLSTYNIDQELDISKLLDLRKAPTFWEKLRGIGNNEKKTILLQKVFGSELKDLTAKTGVESTQSNGPAKVYIPMVIEDLLAALFQKDMSIEGVFRKNGNLKTLKELSQRIDSNPAKVPTLMDENAIQLSALLKKFLREMPTPLLTFRLYDLWILSQKVKDNQIKQLIIELSYSLLPKSHRDLAEVLLFFFMWVSSFAHLDEENGSKMDIHNLATVLSPNLLYANPNDVKRPNQNGKPGAIAATYYEAFGKNEGEHYYLAIEVVDFLIEHNEELSIVPQYLMDIHRLCNFEKADQYSSKELIVKIEQVIKDHPSILQNIGKDASKNDSTLQKHSSFVERADTQQPLRTLVEND